MREICGVFSSKGEILGKILILKAKIITIFTFLILTNFKTDRYLNNFQERLLEY